jgi:hypothetical protein
MEIVGVDALVAAVVAVRRDRDHELAVELARRRGAGGLPLVRDGRVFEVIPEQGDTAAAVSRDVGRIAFRQ